MGFLMTVLRQLLRIVTVGKGVMVMIWRVIMTLMVRTFMMLKFWRRLVPNVFLLQKSVYWSQSSG